MKRITWIGLALLASLLFVAAACTDDDDGDTSNGDTTSPTATAEADGDPDDGDTSGAFDTFSAYAGSWSGDWNNDTFDSTAPLTLTVTVNEDGTASFTFELPGSDAGGPFGLASVASKTFSGTYDESGLTVDVTGDDVFGDLTVTISPEGDLAATATMEPTAAIASLTVTGSLTGSEMNLTYTIVFSERSDPADSSGTVTMTKS